MGLVRRAAVKMLAKTTIVPVSRDHPSLSAEFSVRMGGFQIDQRCRLRL